MVDVANFAARNFGGGPDLANIDLQRTRNALGQLQLGQEQAMGPLRQQALQQNIDLNQANEQRINQQSAEQAQNDKIQWAAGASRYALAHPEAWPMIVKAGIDRGVFPQGYNEPNDPQKHQDFLNQLEVAGFGVKPDTQILPEGATLIRNGQAVATGGSKDKIDYKDAGDRLVPVDAKSGQPSADLQPIKKGMSPASGYTPESVESTAQMIANGQMPMLTGFSLKTPWGQAVINRVSEIKPDYQANVYGTRASAMKDFTSGKAGNTVRSLNVAIAHLGVLGDLSDALNNSDTPALNRISNIWKTQTGNPAPTSFAGARSIVANEIVKAVTASGGGVTDRQEAQAEVSAANSPEQLRQVIGTWKQLLGGQLGGLKQQYEQSTQNQDFNRFLSPEVIQQLEPAGQGGGTPQQAPQQNSAPSAAIDYLKQHPELGAQFKAKYGYLPQ